MIPLWAALAWLAVTLIQFRRTWRRSRLEYLKYQAEVSAQPYGYTESWSDWKKNQGIDMEPGVWALAWWILLFVWKPVHWALCPKVELPEGYQSPTQLQARIDQLERDLGMKEEKKRARIDY